MISASVVKIMRVFCLLLTAALLFSAFPAGSSASPEPEQTAAPSKLEQQVNEWVSVLAKQKLFADWQGADPQIQALGPGTHGWLVLFSKDGRHIGYMVVHAVTDGSFRMGEYGVGSFPLFSQQQLKRSLIRNELIAANAPSTSYSAVRHYLHPLAAVWEVKIDGKSYWLDAKTAELLPLKQSDWDAIEEAAEDRPAAPLLTGNRSRLRLNPTFDAYERLPWLTKEAPFANKDMEKIVLRLNKKQRVRYVTEPYGEAMLYAAPVVGYQRWSGGRLDLALHMEGTRFIPIEALARCGFFYR
ncbi:hypothetical protein SD71_04705 [Cohnella kolymensis]|uniref:Uncharacterized protein n=1 Tax=Cohnella kolymensis TaxID=1590652 RepID=A0ABR5A7J8_9BACL|nr:hypothetical protein [Cohnella kolymensis]KIL36994.1 hypothetical protein SD71_04705 [Cohnella kolymensis]